MPLTGPGGIGPGPQCKGAPNSARLIQIRFGSSVTFQSSFFKGFVSLYFQLKSACFFASSVMLLTQTMHNYLMWLLCSVLARAPHIVFFNLKLLIKDGNLQVYMYCACTKRASGAPRTHFRACKISKFSGGSSAGLSIAI